MSIYSYKEIDFYGLNVEEDKFRKIWFSKDSNIKCVIKDGKREGMFGCYSCFFDKPENPAIITSNAISSFILFCFLAKKDNCKASDIMELLTPDLSSREKYIEQAKKIFKIRGYLGFHVVFGDGPSDCAYTSTFGEKVFRDDHVMFVDKYDDYYECSVYMERGGEKRAVAIIYDESLLYPYLLNEQFYLLLDRADGDW